MTTPLKAPRVHPAYSLEIVVSDDQMTRTGQIVADSPGYVDARVAGTQSSGWVRMVLTTESEQHLVDLANPEPEIDPDVIADLGAIIATGSSDYPNQVNNALAFPGLFRGLLGGSATQFDQQVFLAAAQALANLARPASPTRLLPDVLDPRVAPAISAAVKDVLGRMPHPSMEGTANG